MGSHKTLCSSALPLLGSNQASVTGWLPKLPNPHKHAAAVDIILKGTGSLLGLLQLSCSPPNRPCLSPNQPLLTPSQSNRPQLTPNGCPTDCLSNGAITVWDTCHRSPVQGPPSPLWVGLCEPLPPPSPHPLLKYFSSTVRSLVNSCTQNSLGCASGLGFKQKAIAHSTSKQAGRSKVEVSGTSRHQICMIGTPAKEHETQWVPHSSMAPPCSRCTAGDAQMHILIGL